MQSLQTYEICRSTAPFKPAGAPVDADAMRLITKSRNQLLAALCCFVAAVVGLTISSVASVAILAVGFLFALRAHFEAR